MRSSSARNSPKFFKNKLPPRMTADRFEFCHNLFGSKEEGDGKCDLNLAVDGNLDLNMSEMTKILAGDTFMDTIKQASSEDKFSMKMEVTGISSCMELAKCMQER